LGRSATENKRYDLRYYMIYLLTAIGLPPGGSSTVHIYTQTIHRATQITTEQHKSQLIFGTSQIHRQYIHRRLKKNK